DPHPGNVLIRHDGRLALLDIGMLGRLSPTMQEEMLKLMLAAAEGESDDASEIAIGLCERREAFDAAAFRRAMTDLVMRCRDAPLKAIPVGRVIVENTR